MPSAAGQRPSRAGYGRVRHERPRVSGRATHATATASERHGLKARNTSPNSTLSTTEPTQKIT